MFDLKNSSSVSSVNFSRIFLRAAGLLTLFIVAANAIWLAKAKAQNVPAGQAETPQETELVASFEN